MDDDLEYQLINAKRSRGGIVPRCCLRGEQIKTKTQFFVKAGDFLIANRQIIHGAFGIVPEELDGALVSNEYSTLQPRDGLWLPFFAYFTHTVHFQQTCFHSSIGVDVEKMVFKLDQWLKHEFHLPPVPEQKKIAEILSTLDATIEQTRRLVTAKTRRKKGLMEQLLTGKSRLPGFTQQWRTHGFSVFCRLRAEKVDPKSHRGEVRCIELEHIEQDSGRLLGTVSVQKQASMKNRFRRGDVLFGKLRPYLRKYIRADFDGACSTEIWVLVPKEGTVTSEFLFFLVQTHEFLKAASISCGTKMPRGEFSNLASARFTLPRIEEQAAIAGILYAVDAELYALRRKLVALEKQKRGLMQKLLTGEVRVKV